MSLRWCVPAVAAGLLGACGATTSDGGTECVPTHHGVEICDGIDNDCNGVVDDGASCGGELVCVAGSCACGNATCGSPPVCVDTQTDVANCGGCNHACKVGESCVGGHCECLLAAGPVCGGQCIDLATDPKNCGSCGHVCPVIGSICSGGLCMCPPASIRCGNACVDPASDTHNCATCGTTCDVACSGARCVGPVQVVAGGSHSCVRLEGGEVRCWGEDDSYELGDGQVGDTYYPVQTGVLFASDLAAGSHHTCAISGQQTLCWGSNLHGQIGDGTTTDAQKATAVTGLANATAIALGDTHSCVRRNDGSVACWGGNAHGELGDGTTTERHLPVAVVNLTGVAAIALGSHHSCALRTDGTVACWGSNQFGELGDGATGGYRATPATVAGLPAIVTLRAGGPHTCALDKQSLYCWGANDSHELAPGDPVLATPQAVGASVSAVGLGGAHMCVARYPGLVCTGNVIAATSPMTDPGTTWDGVAAGDLHTCALVYNAFTSKPDIVECWGANTRGQCTQGGPVVAPAKIVEF